MFDLVDPLYFLTKNINKVFNRKNIPRSVETNIEIFYGTKCLLFILSILFFFSKTIFVQDQCEVSGKSIQCLVLIEVSSGASF